MSKIYHEMKDKRKPAYRVKPFKVDEETLECSGMLTIAMFTIFDGTSIHPQCLRVFEEAEVGVAFVGILDVHQRRYYLNPLHPRIDPDYGTQTVEWMPKDATAIPINRYGRDATTGNALGGELDRGQVAIEHVSPGMRSQGVDGTTSHRQICNVWGRKENDCLGFSIEKGEIMHLLSCQSNTLHGRHTHKFEQNVHSVGDGYIDRRWAEFLVEDLVHILPPFP